jgi:hypothetical protein
MPAIQFNLFFSTLILFLSASGVLNAQQRIILYENIFSHKEVRLRTGDEVHLRFTVHDTADAPFDVAVSDITVLGTIEAIGDSSVRLATKNKMFDRASITVPLQSIEAFRKFSGLRPFTKAAVTIAASAAGLLATIRISHTDDILSWENAGIAVTATGLVYMSRQIFPDKMRYFACEGWNPRIVVMPDKYQSLQVE